MKWSFSRLSRWWYHGDGAFPVKKKRGRPPIPIEEGNVCVDRLRVPAAFYDAAYARSRRDEISVHEAMRRMLKEIYRGQKIR